MNFRDQKKKKSLRAADSNAYGPVIASHRRATISARAFSDQESRFGIKRQLVCPHDILYHELTANEMSYLEKGGLTLSG